MSVTLFITLRAEIDLQCVVTRAEERYAELLRLEEPISIVATLFKDGREEVVLRDTRLSQPGTVFVLRSSAPKGVVALTVIPSFLRDEELVASISVHVTGEPLSCALAAALAMALAELAHASIVDDNLVWTNTYETSVASFAQALALPKKPRNNEEAATLFRATMNDPYE